MAVVEGPRAKRMDAEHDVADSGQVPHYERRFAERTGAGAAVAFAYARTALAAILRAAGLQPGDQVLLSPLTCKAVPLAILAAGLDPVYVDIDATTLNLDAAGIAGTTGDRARAVLFQRTYGSSRGAAAAAAIAKERGFFFIEDCAQCMPGSSAWIGDAAIFSCNPGKPLPAGSGGMAVLRDAGVAAGVRERRDRLPQTSTLGAVRTHVEAFVRNRVLTPGLYWPAFELNRRIDRSYRPRDRATEIAHEFDAVAARINDSQARAGITWLGRADEVAAHRATCCDHYARDLHVAQGTNGIDIDTGAPLYYFPVLVDRKDDLLQSAQRRKHEVVAWPIRMPIYPVMDESALATYAYTPGSCPIADQIARRLVGLPTHPLVSTPHRADIIGLMLDHCAGQPV